MTGLRVHGHSKSCGGKPSRTMLSWYAMRARCNNPKCVKYPRYGGRGIKICKQWADFSVFLADMRERPIGKTLDRRDNNGDYEPGNCRWATPKEQADNRDKTNIGWRGARTACPHGHVFDEANTLFVADGSRKCRTCARDAARARRAATKTTASDPQHPLTLAYATPPDLWRSP